MIELITMILSLVIGLVTTVYLFKDEIIKVGWIEGIAGLFYFTIFIGGAIFIISRMITLIIFGQ